MRNVRRWKDSRRIEHVEATIRSQVSLCAYHRTHHRTRTQSVLGQWWLMTVIARMWKGTDVAGTADEDLGAAGQQRCDPVGFEIERAAGLLHERVHVLVLVVHRLRPIRRSVHDRVRSDGQNGSCTQPKSLVICTLSSVSATEGRQLVVVVVSEEYR